MRLKNIELSGFKSFAKKTLLTFDAPITAIVGPNGSGKSNIAEAFRWVLGEQSLKILRGKRGEDLIFNGSGSAPRMSRASVTLTFDNSGRSLPLSFNEVSISREVHTDGASEYLLNRSKVRLKDIVELLASVGLGSTGHHIISQGEADRILRARPREREAMIEEALSLTVYHLKIAESERKLQKTQENLRQVEALRKEIAPHLKFLGKQMEKMRQAESLRDELTALYRDYLAREESYLRRTAQELAAARTVPAQELRDIEARLKNAETLLSRGGPAESDDEWTFTRLRRELGETGNERAELTRKLGRVEGMIEVRSESEGTEADAASIPLADVRTLVEDIEALIAGSEQKSDFTSIKAALTAIREEVRIFIGQFAGSIKSSKASTLSGLTREKEIMERALGAVLAREEGLRAEADTVRARIAEAESLSREKERETYELKAARSARTQELESLDLKRSTFEISERDFKEMLAEARVLIGREALNYSSEHLNLDTETRAAQEARHKQIDRLKFKLEDLGAGGDDIVKEYREVSERDSFLSRELEDLSASEQSLHQVLRELEEILEREFHEGIEKINAEFQKFFELMFGGGTASIFVIKAKRRARGEEEILEEGQEETGIDISVSLPRKKLRGIHMLSGGERALTSIALLFAISQVNPPPFLILDETDAALDEANSRRYGDMIENLSHYSQLIVITHNRETMSRAGILYGVTMNADSISKLLSIRFDEAVDITK
ncbi:MAG TPA: hypothetical protein DIU16_00640 [Candidatus Vogelbacteria bacterium]|uniref:RecF/RecN/SMC N-terminal domain-containing protein n=1 Tax=Candidatus Vogelbacteria bacterium RIFOXYD1_FULL_51_18 TaxID=1802440 RepID=A0A1G2QIV5_9BACT|nr:MAG: Chromosome partition protein Smc [Parcubacteria group bacterium GW2011_GWF2_52_12]OHA60367.1 MAG: hypothetical protein A2569_02905 [Candidatus Vogelbacteria bacterium RIFOXYD1_FULL_51_18]HCQ91865.1 hypothetical protein [Candidatus Vogelbacteria bacterium]